MKDVAKPVEPAKQEAKRGTRPPRHHRLIYIPHFWKIIEAQTEQVI